jgi:hypothetical protein
MKPEKRRLKTAASCMQRALPRGCAGRFISAAKGYLDFKPKCLTCGDDIFRAPALRRLAASLYGLNVTCSRAKVPSRFKMPFTRSLQ